MNRAVLLAYPGDPFLLNYWLHFFDTVWGKEIDTLYIGLNSPIEKPVVDYIYERIRQSEALTGKKIIVDYQNHTADHGPTINRLLDLVTEDLIMLIEDDGFIFKPGYVADGFSHIEEGHFDIVGSKRGSAHSELLKAAQDKWGISYEGEGDQGPNFWPNFLFLSRELLLKTDRNFAAKAWHKGEIIEGLGHVVENEVIYGDTFVNTSMQLRDLVPINRILPIPQYHGHPSDLEHATAQKYLFDGKAPWTHIGSLSSGISGALRDAYNRPLANRLNLPAEPETKLPLDGATSDFEKQEWERRVQWWLRFATFFNEETTNKDKLSDGIIAFWFLYAAACQQIIDQYGLSDANIRRRQKVYRLFLGL